MTQKGLYIGTVFLIFISLIMVGPSELYTSRGVGAHRGYISFGPLTREAALSEIGVDWYYDWSASPPIYDGIEAVPMIWDETVVGKPLGGNSGWILTFNESDSPYQADMSLTLSAQLYHQVDLDNPSKKLVSPVPTADNWEWRNKWLAEYKRLYEEDPRVDAVSAHIYPRTWGYFIQAMDAAWEFAQKFDARIWVTEYAYLPCWDGGMSQAASMMRQMTEYFEDNPSKFERWAPFILGATGYESWNFDPKPACNPTLFSMDMGQLTPIGLAYKLDIAHVTPTFTIQPTLTPIIYADPRADVDGNKMIDIRDIVIVGSNFGRMVR